MRKESHFISNISYDKFESWQPSLKVIVHDHARRFASVLHDPSSQYFAVSWRSELIEPVLVTGNQFELWIGVDQHVVCINKEGCIKTSIELASSLLDIRPFNDCTAVLCETEVVLFNSDNSIRTIIGLQDIPTDISECSEGLVVSFDNGTQKSIG